MENHGTLVLPAGMVPLTRREEALIVGGVAPLLVLAGVVLGLATIVVVAAVVGGIVYAVTH